MQGTPPARVLYPGLPAGDPEILLAQGSAGAAEQALGYTPGSQLNITPGPPLDIDQAVSQQLWHAAVVQGLQTGEAGVTSWQLLQLDLPARCVLTANAHPPRSGDLYTSGWSADLSGPLLAQGDTAGNASISQLKSSTLGAWVGLHQAVREVALMGTEVVSSAGVEPRFAKVSLAACMFTTSMQ
jgi:hypothetical protein